jgi:hypothetical protein
VWLVLTWRVRLRGSMGTFFLPAGVDGVSAG